MTYSEKIHSSSIHNTCFSAFQQWVENLGLWYWGHLPQPLPLLPSEEDHPCTQELLQWEKLHFTMTWDYGQLKTSQWDFSVVLEFTTQKESGSPKVNSSNSVNVVKFLFHLPTHSSPGVPWCQKSHTILKITEYLNHDSCGRHFLLHWWRIKRMKMRGLSV